MSAARDLASITRARGLDRREAAAVFSTVESALRVWQVRKALRVLRGLRVSR